MTITIVGRNVNSLYVDGLVALSNYGERQESRNGPVVVMPYPVVSIYHKPTERVLFHRPSANPFFHLMESLWMLAGRDDVSLLNHYISDFGTRYGDDGVIHGAYGRRWRHALGFDQLDHVVERLKKNHDDRQCVIQMWDASQGDQCGPVNMAAEHCDDLCGDWKDRPCNTHAYLRVRRRETLKGESGPAIRRVLDLTVCCRSNDVIWGAYGANAVHFSMLQEYLAGRIGVDVGTMYQVSNNYHGYVAELDKIGDPHALRDLDDQYTTSDMHSYPIGENWGEWDSDLASFMRWHDALYATSYQCVAPAFPSTLNTWFHDVAMYVALSNYHRINDNKYMAAEYANRSIAPDWRFACGKWLARRQK